MKKKMGKSSSGDGGTYGTSYMVIFEFLSLCPRLEHVIPEEICAAMRFLRRNIAVSILQNGSPTKIYRQTERKGGGVQAELAATAVFPSVDMFFPNSVAEKGKVEPIKQKEIENAGGSAYFNQFSLSKTRLLY